MKAITRTARRAFILGPVLALAACGGASEDPQLVEKIVVRAPGDPPVNPTDGVDGGGDLVAMGQTAFAVCSACHTVVQGEASGAGPNLYGVVGARAALRDDFGYSDALTASGITWTARELDQFLANPTVKVPGTSMVAGAVADDEQRAAIAAYLSSLSE